MENTSAPGCSSPTICVDEECHNEYYLAMRSGNIKRLETLTSKHPSESQEVEDLLAATYEELKLKNVELTDEMELYVGSRLLDLRFFDTSLKKNKNVVAVDHVKGRAEMVIEVINQLVEEYAGEGEVDNRFLFIGKFIAQNIHILKRQVRSTYDRLPWEETEFCLIAYVSSKLFNDELHCISDCVLTKVRILKHLQNFSNSLENDLHHIEKLHRKKRTCLPRRRSRVITVENIMKERPFFEELYNDYKLIRDIYSLEAMKCYIELALTANHQEKKGQLVIIRALQVIGENVKNTLESPKLSSSTAELLLISLPKNTRRILTVLRDSLSHSHSVLNRTLIEENADGTFFSQLRNDIETIGKTIYEILLKNKTMIVRENLKNIVRDENIDQMKELAKIYSTGAIMKLMSESNIEVGLKELETLMEKLSKVMKDKTSYETNLLSQIKIIINDHNNKLSNFRNEYMLALNTLSVFGEMGNNISEPNRHTIKEIKNWANQLLNYFNPIIEADSFTKIINYTMDILNSTVARKHAEVPGELIAIIYEIIHFINYEMGNVKCIEDLKDKLNQSQNNLGSIKDRSRSDCQAQDHKFLLNSKLSSLKTFLNTNRLSERSTLPENASCIKSNKKLQTVLEIIVLDILAILSSSQGKLCDNILEFDATSPLLSGKQLRNHLAHGNAFNNLLSFEHSNLVILNARKLTIYNFTDDMRKIGKLVNMDLFMLKKRFENNLATVTNQRDMFASIAEGNVEQFNSVASRGADIFGKNNNSWTALHYAAKGSNIEFVKFLIDKKVNIDTKDVYGRTPLHIASLYGKDGIVKLLKEEVSVSVDDIDSSGKTALHLAAQNGHNETVKILLTNKASTVLKDVMGSSPLHWAVRNNFKEVAETLLGMERNVDSNEHLGGSTSLHIAAECGHVELVNVLLERKAKVNARDDGASTPLHLAALNGHVEVVKSLISKGANVNANTLDGNTPLNRAAANGGAEVVEILLHHGADVNIVDDQYKRSPLNSAAKNGQLEIVKLLLKKGSDINNPDAFGLTPLHISAANGHKDIVNFLMQHKCNINAGSHSGHTALHCSAQGGYVEILNILISEGAQVEALDNLHRTPLHIAAANGRIHALETLISQCADINARDSNGMSVLHFVAGYGSKDLIRKFIKHLNERKSIKRTEINVRNIYNMTPLHIAVQENTIDVVQALLEAGADVHATDNNGLAALHMAVMRGEQEIVQTLIQNNANIEVECDRGYTPMHTAAIYGHMDLTVILTKKGAEVDLPDKNGNTPLCHAIKTRNFGMAKFLIKKRANVNVDSGRPLSLAVESGYKEMVVYLLKNENIVIIPFLLHKAVFLGHRSITDYLLERGADIDVESEVDRVRPLYLAIEKGHTDVVKFLLTKNANVNALSRGRTPLHIAVDLELIGVVSNLLENGAHPNIRDSMNITPIELSVSMGHVEILNLLLQHTPESIKDSNNNGFTILHTAAQKGNVGIVKYLIDKGAYIHATNADGMKPIHIAARAGHTKTLDYFLSHNVSINELDVSGSTLLHHAASGGQTKILEYLIKDNIKQGKIEVNVSDRNGSKPIHIACSYNFLDVVKLLLNNGAYYNAINNVNKKPLDVTENDDITKILQSTEQLFKAVCQGNSLEVERCLNEGACINAKSIIDEIALHSASLSDLHNLTRTQMNDLPLKQNVNVNIVDETGCTPLHCAAKCGHPDVVNILLSRGAIYDAVTNRRNTPLDFAENRHTVDLIKLVTDSFKNVQRGNLKVLDRLNKIKDVDTLKAVMNACNREHRTLIVAAIHKNFSAINELKNISQIDISSENSKAQALALAEKYDEVFEVLSTALKKRSAIYSSDNPAILDIHLNIASVLCNQHKYQEALDLLDDIYKKQKYILGKHHKDTLNTRRDYAQVLFHLGRYTESFKICEEVYMKQKEILQSSDIDIVRTRFSMAATLAELKSYEEALNMNYKVLNICKRLSIKADPFYLSVQNNVAGILLKQAKYEEAFTLFEQVYEGLKETLGPFHSDTLRTLHNKTAIWIQKKDYEKALRACRDIFETQKYKLGPRHLDTLQTQENIGNILYLQGKINGAHRIYTETLAHRMTFLAPDHPVVLENLEKIEKINKSLQFRGQHPGSNFRYCQNDFHNAASSGNETLAQSLIDRGFEVNASDTDGRTPLFYAVYGGHRHIVELLLTNGADITVVTMKGNTTLHTAASKGRAEILNIMLRHLKLTNGEIRKGFIDARTTVTGSTSLHVAAKFGSEEIVKSLLEYGATYNSLDSSQRTPLGVARDVNIVILLNLMDELFENVKSGGENITLRLNTLKADECRFVLNARDVSGKTLLQTALTNKLQNIARGIIAIMKSQT